MVWLLTSLCLIKSNKEKVNMKISVANKHKLKFKKMITGDKCRAVSFTIKNI